MEYKYLTRKQYILEAGITDEMDKDTIIPFDNMTILTGEEDPTKIIIPSFSKMIETINELKLVVFDTKYVIEYPASEGVTTLPTAAELNAAYVDGIPVQDLNGNDIILKSTPGVGDEPFPVVQMNEGEGMLVVIESNGKFEEAGFTSNRWVIDNSKDQLSNQISDLDTRLIDNTNKDAALEARVTTIETQNANDFLVPANDKPITGFGVLDTTGTVIEGDRIARRDEIASPLASLKQEIDANKVEADATKVTADAANVLSTNNKALIDTNTADITTNKATLTDQGTRIVVLEGDDISHDMRIEALEEAQDLDDKVWEDNSPIDFTGTNSGTASIASITDQNGNSFVYNTNKRVEVYIKHTGTNVGQGHTIVIDSSTPIQYVIPNGASSDAFTISLNTNGVLTGTITNGNDNMNEFQVYRVVEAKSVAVVSTSYSKTESDGKYTLKTTTGDIDARVTAQRAMIDALDPRITTNTTNIVTNGTDIVTNKNAIALKQDAVDNTLTTTTKSVVGAINELKSKDDNIESDIDELNKGNFDVNLDGTKVVKLFDTSGNAQLEASGMIGGAVPYHTAITTNGGNEYNIESTVAGVKTESPIATQDWVSNNAGGGWTTITDLWSNSLKFDKYRDYQVRVTVSDGSSSYRSHIFELTAKLTTTGTAITAMTGLTSAHQTSMGQDLYTSGVIALKDSGVGSASLYMASGQPEGSAAISKVEVKK